MTCLSGFCVCVCVMYTERLEKELQNYLPSSSICNGVKVIPPPCGVDTAWHGGKLISNVSSILLLIFI